MTRLWAPPTGVRPDRAAAEVADRHLLTFCEGNMAAASFGILLSSARVDRHCGVF